MSQAAFTYSGLPLTPRCAPSMRRMLANFVAMSTRSLSPPRKAWDSSISLCPTPYMSAVSKNVIPSSTARLSSATEAASSDGP